MTPISAIGRSEDGFTLIELLAVIAIVAVLASAVLLSASDPGGSLAGETERFGERLARARDEAILSGRKIEAWVSGAGYGFDLVRAGGRIAMREKPFGGFAWESGTTAVLPQSAASLRIGFDPVGLATPAAIEFSRGNARVRLTVETNGQVIVDAPLP